MKFSGNLEVFHKTKIATMPNLKLLISFVRQVKRRYALVGVDASELPVNTDEHGAVYGRLDLGQQLLKVGACHLHAAALSRRGEDSAEPGEPPHKHTWPNWSSIASSSLKTEKPSVNDTTKKKVEVKFTNPYLFHSSTTWRDSTIISWRPSSPAWSWTGCASWQTSGSSET